MVNLPRCRLANSSLGAVCASPLRKQPDIHRAIFAILEGDYRHSFRTMNSKTLWIILAVVVVAGIAWWLYSMNVGTAQAPQTATTTGEVQGASDQFTDNSKDGGVAVTVGATVGTPATVTLTASGFSPSTVTIKEGQSVTFVNKTSSDMWIASDDHPDHIDYDGTSKDTHCAPGYAGPKPFDECGTATSYTFTFTKAGTFGYHNHADHDLKGTVIVTP